jgi:hypothetical protein
VRVLLFARSRRGSQVTRVEDILEDVQRQTGISFSEVETGGGCRALEARLESGHWIVATDQNLMGFRRRIELEADEGTPMGWMVGIYPNNNAHGDDWWGGGDDAIVDVTDYNAFAGDLARVVIEALEGLTAFYRKV